MSVVNEQLNNDIFFWTGFYKDEDCVSWASNKAYLDMNRTMTFKEKPPKNGTKEENDRVAKQREDWRKGATEIIKKRWRSLK